ncbi:MAG: hypothetical protein CBB71_14040 [Rhodopirellula sp. TMED11]|nr:MAG: hypothetical protein CBB71_14040 [Rhodopirellula sp. TMED11]
MAPSDLNNLHDIHQPVAISHWPLAPGWWFLIAIGFSVALITALRWHRRWKRTAYRRAALAELHSATSTAEVAEIMKRTALAGFGRAEVAILTGHDWIQWLRRSTDLELEQQVADDLSLAIYRSPQPPQEALLRFAGAWIETHRDTTSPQQADSC